ncbi:hypothetical protein BJX99DRAFT_126877 [Aspergillus californicus]
MDVVSKLGDFGKLPAELRLLIWENALSDGSTAIMRSNRTIYEDISYKLYDTIEIHLYPRHDDPWMMVSCKRLRLSWSISREKDCLSSGFWNMPYDKTKLAINVHAPDPSEKAQYIHLWGKARALAAILEQIPESKSIEVTLRSHNGHNWQQNTESLKLSRAPRLDRDDDIILIPFCQLSNIRDINVAFNLDSLSTETQTHPNLDSLITDIDFAYDAELDNLPGETAAMLRFNRFATWLSNPLDKASYEPQTLTTLRNKPNMIATNDPFLEKLRHRYNCYDTCLINVMNELKHHHQRHDQNREDWLAAYPNGIPPLSKDWLRAERKIIYERLDIEHVLPIDITQPCRWSEFWHAIEAYAHRNYNVFPVHPARITTEGQWCAACRSMGFREGCDTCVNVIDYYTDALYEILPEDDEGDGDANYDETAEMNYNEDDESRVVVSRTSSNVEVASECDSAFS